MIYLVKKGGSVLTFYGEAEMKTAGFAKADKTAGEEEFAANGCYARVVGGEIVVGKTVEEKAEAERAAAVAELKKNLADTDYIACKIAEGSATKAEYADIIARRQEWRERIVALESEAAA